MTLGTKDVYGHLLEGDKRAAVESMSGLLSGTRPGKRDSQPHRPPALMRQRVCYEHGRPIEVLTW